MLALRFRCPPEDSIAELVRGGLADAPREALSAHVASCEACALVFAAATSDLRGPEPSAFELAMPSVDTSITQLSADGRHGSRPSELATQVHVGRYILSAPVGRGGMGVVYAAHDPKLCREVAIKLLNPGEERERPLREAQAMARLSHPNVVTVHDVGEHGDQVFIAMEYIRGQTLRRWVRERRPSWREVVDVFLAAGRGLAAAHEARLIHRDFKPENVLLGVDGRVCVTDFGLARPVDGGDEPIEPEQLDSGAELRAYATSVWKTMGIVGTPPYMSPEQLGRREVDARTDQYSFCVSLFEALFDVRPFSGASFEEVAAQIAEWKIRLPSRSEVPRRIQQVVLRGLGFNPDDRFASMDELLAALSTAAQERSRVRPLAIAGAIAVGAALAIGFALPRLARTVVPAQAGGGAPVAAGEAPTSDGAVTPSVVAAPPPSLAAAGAEVLSEPAAPAPAADPAVPEAAPTVSSAHEDDILGAARGRAVDRAPSERRSGRSKRRRPASRPRRASPSIAAPAPSADALRTPSFARPVGD
jgi:tRNA A-37 threonylcarbamoyl transferase component Bud32